MINPRFISIILFTLCSLVTAWAGRPDKAGTAAAPHLLIPVGGRAIGIGGSSIATISGIEAIYWNPAGVARSARASNAIFTHMTYLADIGVDYLAISNSFQGFGTIAVSIKSLSIGDIPITTEDAPDGTGEITSPSFITLGATYSKQLTDRIGVGFTLSLISERMERVSSSGAAFSMGVQYAGVAGIPGLSLGVAVKNIGPQMKYDGPGLLRTGNIDDVTRPGSFYLVQAATAELPSVMEIGLGYSIPLQNLGSLDVTTLFQNNNFSQDEYKFGAEYSYNRWIFLRGGYEYSREDERPDFIYGGTGGAGVRSDLGGVDASIDYAYRSADFFGGNHVFSIILGF